MSLGFDQLDPYWEAPDPEKYAKTAMRARRLIRLCWGLNVVGEDNIPNEGAGIVAFVHRSVLDPWIVGAAIPRAVSGMAKIELLNWYYFGLGSRYFANRGISFVDRNYPSTEGLRPTYNSLRKKRLVAMAPEGTTKIKGARVGEIKIGVGRIAAKMMFEGIDCPIVPMTVTSEHLRPRKTIHVLAGECILPDPSTKSIRDAAEEVNERLYASLQALNDQALELR